MKKIICTLLLTLPTTLFAQELKINEETGKYTKEAVVNIDSMKMIDIYKKTVEWIAINYKSANDVIQLKDADIGKIILKGNFSTDAFMKQGWIKHTLIIDFKDNKFKYSYSDFSYYSSGSGEIEFEKSMMSKKKIVSETEADIDSSISSLKAYILKSNKNNVDW